MSPAPSLDWDEEALRRQLEPLLPGLTVEIAQRLPSTNTSLLERARRGPEFKPCLLVAQEQTRGRGRLGREWWSSGPASLTFSLALPLAPADWAGLSLAVGLALAQALDPCAAASDVPRIGLKWPNDLWLIDGPGRGRKLGGILIETVSTGSRRVCVVGVGLNVLAQPVAAPQALRHGYAGLQEIAAAASAPWALAQLAEPLLRGLLRFEAEGFAPCVAAYARRDLLKGRSVSTTLPELPEGLAEGVDASGALWVRRGELFRVVSGEVSVRLGAELEAEGSHGAP